MTDHLAVIQTYFDLVQEFSTDPVAYAAVLHPEVEQTEYPNALNKTLQRRSFEEIMENLRTGREILRNPSFEVHATHTTPAGLIIVEGFWQAFALNDVGPLLRGQRVAANLYLVFEFKEDKIYRQRRYPNYGLL